MRHILLEGERGIGKSRLLREVLQEYLPYACGFATLRLWQGEKLRAFCHIPASRWGEYPYGSAVYTGNEEGNIILFDEAGTQWRQEVFRAYSGAKLLKRQGKERYMVLDEIGGFELEAPDLTGLLLAAFDSLPCIGVLKKESNVRQEDQKAHAAFRAALRKRRDVRILELREDNTKAVRKEVLTWIHQYAKGEGESGIRK